MVHVLRIAALQGVEGLSIGRIDHGQRAAAGGCEGSVGDEIELHERIVRQNGFVCEMKIKMAFSALFASANSYE